MTRFVDHVLLGPHSREQQRRAPAVVPGTMQLLVII